MGILDKVRSAIGGVGKLTILPPISPPATTAAPPATTTTPPTTPVASSRPYDASSTGRRTKSWSYNTDSVNTILFSEADRLRAYCRDAVRKTSWASAAIDSYTANAIGTGIKPLCQYQDENIRKLIHKAWLRWTDEADFDELTDFYGLQTLAFRSMLEAGEVLARIHITPFNPLDPTRASIVPLQIQLLEVDHLPYNQHRNGVLHLFAGILRFRTMVSTMLKKSLKGLALIMFFLGAVTFMRPVCAYKAYNAEGGKAAVKVAAGGPAHVYRMLFNMAFPVNGTAMSAQAQDSPFFPPSSSGVPCCNGYLCSCTCYHLLGWDYNSGSSQYWRYLACTMCWGGCCSGTQGPCQG